MGGIKLLSVGADTTCDSDGKTSPERGVDARPKLGEESKDFDWASARTGGDGTESVGGEGAATPTVAR